MSYKGFYIEDKGDYFRISKNGEFLKRVLKEDGYDYVRDLYRWLDQYA